MNLTLERGDHVELAEHLLVQLRAQTNPLVGDEARIHGYRSDTGIYKPLDPSRLSVIVQGFAGATVAGSTRPLSIRATDVNGVTRLAYDRIAEPGFFAGARPGLAFANGFVSVSADGPVLMPHSPEHRARFAYGFDYAGNVPPKALLAFLHALFRDDHDREEKILCLQEHLGASLVGQELKRIERGNKRARQEFKRATAKERRGESDDEVRANLSPEDRTDAMIRELRRGPKAPKLGEVYADEAPF
jgi:hypothetical protein